MKPSHGNLHCPLLIALTILFQIAQYWLERLLEINVMWVQKKANECDTDYPTVMGKGSWEPPMVPGHHQIAVMPLQAGQVFFLHFNMQNELGQRLVIKNPSIFYQIAYHTNQSEQLRK